MFKHLLVPLDGSALAESVLPVVAHLARVLGSSVSLIHAVESGAPRVVHGERHLVDGPQASAYLADAARRCLDGVVAVECHVHSDAVQDVAASIVSHAQDEIESDLIVLCTHGSGGTRRLLFGSIAQQVIAAGRTPVLVIRAGQATTAEDLCRSILVPLDAGGEHEQALGLVADLAVLCGSSLHLLAVVPTTSTAPARWSGVTQLLPGSSAHLLDLAEQDAHAYLLGKRTSLVARGLSVHAHVVRGDAATAITRIARGGSVGLVAIATHGRAGMSAFWEESVAARICEMCALPLLLVPAART
jgi:nucleotide-binding universal stress UspA family protein